MTTAAARVVGADLAALAAHPPDEAVVVGIIDAGFDGSHAELSANIDRAWDTTVPGARSVDLVDGREWTAAPFTGLTDLRGHGTHLAGIVAAFAPWARLVTVKTDLGEEHILAGIRYVFDRADELECPAVVNLSLGLPAVDPHDGTDPFCRGVDALSGPGRIICCAAGNDGGPPARHAQADLDPGATVGLFLVVAAATPPVEGEAPAWRGASFWLGDVDGDVTVTVEDRRHGSVSIDTAVEDLAMADLGANEVRLEAAADPFSGLAQVAVLVRPRAGRVQVAETAFLVRISGLGLDQGCRVDGWTHTGGSAFAAIGGRVPAGVDRPAVVDHAMLVRRPGSARQTITVGACASRASWETRAGRLPDPKLHPHLPIDAFVVGEHLWFSSGGPTRDGRKCPDILAPGAPIASWRALTAPFPDLELTPSGDAIMLGSSQATAIVSALVAGLLARMPQLTPDDVRKRLVAAGSRTSYHPEAGYGVVRAGSL